MDEENAVENATHFFEERINLFGEFRLPVAWHHVGDELVVACLQFVDHGAVSRVRAGRLFGNADEFVGHTAKGRHHHDDGLLGRLNDALDAGYALGGAYRTTAEFENFHRLFGMGLPRRKDVLPSLRD